MKSSVCRGVKEKSEWEIDVDVKERDIKTLQFYAICAENGSGCRRLYRCGKYVVLV